MFSYRTSRDSATRDIVLPLRPQCRWKMPCPWRYLLVYFLSLSPALHGRSKDFGGLSGFPLNNHRKCIRPSFDRDQQRLAHRPFFPFHSTTTAFQHSLPAWLVLSPIQDLYGGSCFSQSGLA